MLAAVPQALFMMSLMVSVGGQDEESTVAERPYTVLQKQNLGKKQTQIQARMIYFKSSRGLTTPFLVSTVFCLIVSDNRKTVKQAGYI